MDLLNKSINQSENYIRINSSNIYIQRLSQINKNKATTSIFKKQILNGNQSFSYFSEREPITRDEYIVEIEKTPNNNKPPKYYDDNQAFTEHLKVIIKELLAKDEESHNIIRLQKKDNKKLIEKFKKIHENQHQNLSEPKPQDFVQEFHPEKFSKYFIEEKILDNKEKFEEEVIDDKEKFTSIFKHSLNRNFGLENQRKFVEYWKFHENIIFSLNFIKINFIKPVQTMQKTKWVKIFNKEIFNDSNFIIKFEMIEYNTSDSILIYIR